jgi:hypothetical protein
MLRIILFASAAGLAFVPDAQAHSVHPRAALSVLWNQNSPDSDSIISQNYTSGGFTDDNAAGADDFVVPKGHVWTIEEVDVSGVDSYYPISSMNITFYANHEGKNGGIDTPGKAVKQGAYADVGCTESEGGNYACTLPGGGGKGTKYPKFKPGRYWVSVVANGNYIFGWSWSENGTISGDAAEWENPGGGLGTGCATWNTLSSCGGAASDFAFDLQGTTRK